MKKILVFDLITDDGSICEKDSLIDILGLEKGEDGFYLTADNSFGFVFCHLPTTSFDLSELNKFDAVIFSGSIRSAYEDFAWKQALHAIFDEVLRLRKKAYAVCFGAQFLAYHLGAPVSKNPKGVEFGMINVCLSEEGKRDLLFKPFVKEQCLFATHNDYIEKTPDGAVLLASNEMTPVQAFRYGEVLATQFHSDIPMETARKLLQKRKEQYLASGFIKSESDYDILYNSLSKVPESYEFLRAYLRQI